MLRRECTPPDQLSRRPLAQAGGRSERRCAVYCAGPDQKKPPDQLKIRRPSIWQAPAGAHWQLLSLPPLAYLRTQSLRAGDAAADARLMCRARAGP